MGKMAEEWRKMMISLTRNQKTTVDASDFIWLSQWKWYAMWDSSQKQFKAARKEDSKTVLMHRQILGLGHGDNLTVDHRDGNTLNNRRRNLRKATNAQNNRNQRRRASNTSGFKGVTFYKKTGKWMAQIRGDGMRKCSYHDTAELAARAYDETAKDLQGEFALLNFPSGRKS